MFINDSVELLDEISRFLLSGPDIEVIGMLEDEEEAAAEIARLHPQMVVLGVRRGGAAAFKTAERLRRQFPTVGIILMGSGEDRQFGSSGGEHGADDFVEKRRIQRDLLPAIQRALALH